MKSLKSNIKEERFKRRDEFRSFKVQELVSFELSRVALNKKSVQ